MESTFTRRKRRYDSKGFPAKNVILNVNSNRFYGHWEEHMKWYNELTWTHCCKRPAKEELKEKNASYDELAKDISKPEMQKMAKNQGKQIHDPGSCHLFNGANDDPFVFQIDLAQAGWPEMGKNFLNHEGRLVLRAVK